MPDFIWQQGVPIANTLCVSASAQRLLVLHHPMRALRDPEVRTFLMDPVTEVLGSGSNVLLLSDELPRVAQIQAKGWWALQRDTRVWITAEVGLWLDTLVRETASRGWYGLERLAEIPGTCGAAPMQNVGAYGLQLSERVTGVTVWDRQTGQVSRWSSTECGFAYRDSRFKQEEPRWLILAVHLLLSTQRPKDWPPVDYPGVRPIAEARAAARGDALSALTPLDMVEIITQVRRKKLPDWRSPPPGSAGSFFQNPVVPAEKAAALQAQFPELPQYPTDAPDQIKLSAGWLIERCGWRGYRSGDAGVFDAHALVLVNHGQATGAALWALAQRIQQDVQARFGVWLIPEPRQLSGR
ncbi:UDP-N-acetylmuramate dehydrogenase [Halothiobacillus sp. DCM-1]|uniref:UDP-N-acetylmuramate dehydrogenase n=1 Tax=Halothiobacillus sp. DCM-1 TaxID=3112558 RepID=UPI00324FEC86